MNIQTNLPTPAVPSIASTQIKLEKYFIPLVALHAVLGLALNFSAVLSTLHAVMTLFAGLYFVWQFRQPARMLYAIGYIVGSEVLWRMTDAIVFWEYGKYASALLLIAAILKWGITLRPLPVLYFALLLPGVVLTAGGLAIWAARQEISFNLSGPFLLMLAAVFFYHVRMPRQVLKNFLLFLVLPTVSIGAIAVYTILTAPNIYFSPDSNVITSGGFGPNQVSATLGLGALCCWLYFLILKRQGINSWAVLVIGIWLLGQTVFTFSRGGVLNFLIAAVVGAGYLLVLDNRSRWSASTLILVTTVALLIIFPWLDRYSQGTLSLRYQDLGTTNRVQIMMSDLELWQENFWFGVGPGGATVVRAGFEGRIAAHTEYSRLLAEHGLLGMFAMISLGVMGLVAFRKARTRYEKGLVLAFMFWSFVEMTHSAMRVAAISIMFGMAFSSYPDE